MLPGAEREPCPPSEPEVRGLRHQGDPCDLCAGSRDERDERERRGSEHLLPMRTRTRLLLQVLWRYLTLLGFQWEENSAGSGVFKRVQKMKECLISLSKKFQSRNPLEKKDTSSKPLKKNSEQQDVPRTLILMSLKTSCSLSSRVWDLIYLLFKPNNLLCALEK